MKYGVVMPMGDARTAAEYAREAERAGWDGFFVWEGVWSEDAWVTLGACAMVTQTIRLGTLLTPVSRRRPWKLASETATVDRLSNGRLILSVGLGAPHPGSGWPEFGEVTDRKLRAERMDEGLEILQGLWKGQPFAFEGKHYHVKPMVEPGPPVPAPPAQKPRIPIWVVGALNRERSLRRVLKYDGLLPTLAVRPGTDEHHSAFTPDDLCKALEWILPRRELATPLDVIVENVTPGDDPNAGAEIVKPWAEAGATWHIESMWSLGGEADGLAQVLKRIRQGPPRATA